MIIADENIDKVIITSLRRENKVISIAEDYKGFDDEDIIEVVKTFEGILLTGDKDFGEWVFAHGKKGFSVIFLRYSKKDITAVLQNIVSVIPEITKNEHLFIAITKNKIRIRKI